MTAELEVVEQEVEELKAEIEAIVGGLSAQRDLTLAVLDTLKDRGVAEETVNELKDRFVAIISKLENAEYNSIDEYTQDVEAFFSVLDELLPSTTATADSSS